MTRSTTPRRKRPTLPTLRELLREPPPLSTQRAPDERIGQLSLWWQPSVQSDKRTAVLNAMRDIKPARRTARLGHAASRAAWERRGERAIAATDSPEITATNRAYHSHVVRIYYRSIGDEVLYFEVRDLTEDEAKELYLAHARMRDVFGKHVCATGSEAIDADRWHAEDGQIPPVVYGARLVVLPSQHPNPVQVIDAGETAGEERAA